MDNNIMISFGEILNIIKINTEGIEEIKKPENREEKEALRVQIAKVEECIDSLSEALRKMKDVLKQKEHEDTLAFLKEMEENRELEWYQK